MVQRHRTSLFPILVILIVALILFYPAWKKLLPEEWLRITPKAVATKPTVKVWVNKRSGLYYCPESGFYGKLQPGFYATQQEAVQTGYRPAGREACQ
jgi:hypothetical protein